MGKSNAMCITEIKKKRRALKSNGYGGYALTTTDDTQDTITVSGAPNSIMMTKGGSDAYAKYWNHTFQNNAAAFAGGVLEGTAAATTTTSSSSTSTSTSTNTAAASTSADDSTA